jgi:hypothetical protein
MGEPICAGPGGQAHAPNWNNQRTIPLFLTPLAPVTIIAPVCDGGAVAQLGERLVRNEEVVGSIPIGSTNPPSSAMSLSITESFAQQAQVCRQLGSPFTALVVEAIAAQLGGDADVVRALRIWSGDPVAGALPLRIAGALHALVLQGVDAELAAHYPPHPAADPRHLQRAVHGAFERHRAHCLAWLERAPQTNEAMRSAAFLLGLADVFRATGLPLSIREIGASAGLNLHWDRFRYRLGETNWGRSDSTVFIAPSWEGASPQLPTAIPVADRAAADLHPLDPANEDHRLRLRSYLWPDQAARLQRFEGALAIAAASPVRVEQIDAAAFVEREFAATVGGVTRVLAHTIVWPYLTAAMRSAIERRLEAAGAAATREAPVAHVAFRWDGGAQQHTLAVTVWPDGRRRVLAMADPHLVKVNWLGL